jgi:hypothetical protein
MFRGIVRHDLCFASVMWGGMPGSADETGGTDASDLT